MSVTDLSVAFVLGLVGSLHCVQMCGPLVLAYSLPLSTESRRRRLAAHISYNAGRTATYTLLGIAAGALGSAVGLLRPVAGTFNVVALAAGVAMSLASLSMFGVVRLPARLSLPSGALASAPRLAGRFLRSPSAGAKLAMGIALGFLPCGLLYAALFKAVESGSPLRGGLSMLAFGAGTSGALLLTALFSGAVASWLGRWSARLPAVAVLLTGLFLLWRGLMGVGPAAPPCH